MLYESYSLTRSLFVPMIRNMETTKPYIYPEDVKVKAHKGKMNQVFLQTGKPKGFFRSSQSHPDYPEVIYKGYSNGKELWTTKAKDEAYALLLKEREIEKAEYRRRSVEAYNEQLERDYASGKKIRPLMPNSYHNLIYINDWDEEWDYERERRTIDQTVMDEYLQGLVTGEEFARVHMLIRRRNQLNAATPRGWAIDHIIPYSWGGLTEPNNLKIVPYSWNSKKRNFNCFIYSDERATRCVTYRVPYRMPRTRKFGEGSLEFKQFRFPHPPQKGFHHVN